MTIRILLADDHELFLAGIRTVLEQETDMEVIAEAKDGRAAIETALEEKPDMVVMDVNMPSLNGIEATRQIVAKLPNVKVLCLSMHHERRLVLAVLNAGASAYVVKESALNELIDAIRNVVRGRTYLSPAIAGTVIEAYKAARSTEEAAPFDVLTDREREVLQLIAEGCTTRKIADRLNVSGKTVSTHREHIMRKLNLHSVAEMTKYAIREGITSADL